MVGNLGPTSTDCRSVVGVCVNCDIGEKCVATGEFNDANQPVVTCSAVHRVTFRSTREPDLDPTPTWQSVNLALLQEESLKLGVEDLTVREYTNLDEGFSSLGDDTVEFQIDVVRKDDDDALATGKDLLDFVGDIANVTLVGKPTLLVRPGTQPE